MPLTPTGVRKINENVFQEGRTLIITDKDAANYTFSDLPDGTIKVDTKTGSKQIKIEGESTWVPDPAEIKPDGTVCIIKDAKIVREKFTIHEIDAANKKFKYKNSDGQLREKPITDDGYYVFETEKGAYIPHRSHLNVMLDGCLLRNEGTGDVEEITNRRFILKEKLIVGQDLDVTYMVWVRIGNPYPRIYMNNNEPTDAEVGDFWLDTDASILDNDDIGDDYYNGTKKLPWSQISGTPTTLAGYGITDNLSRVGHKHTVNEIENLDDRLKNISAKNADTVDYHKPGTQPGNVLLLGIDGKIPMQCMPDDVMNSRISRGMIIAWYGTALNVPSGWAICNGSNGTPDLRDRFIVGAGGKRESGIKGGEENVTLSVDQMPSHGHDVNVNTGAAIGRFDLWKVDPEASGCFSQQYIGNGIKNANSRNSGGDPVWRINFNIANMLNSIQVNDAGGSKAHNNMPPFYALYYIMKL